MVELQARFDEQRNIEWSRTLEEAGVQVVHGAPNLKVHAKLTLLERRERDGIRRYVHVGTGNYHASNASRYEDSASSPRTTRSPPTSPRCSGRRRPQEPKPFRKLLVGPWFLRTGLLSEIERSTRAARGRRDGSHPDEGERPGRPADHRCALRGSPAGVEVEIVARGICLLRPRVPG